MIFGKMLGGLRYFFVIRSLSVSRVAWVNYMNVSFMPKVPTVFKAKNFMTNTRLQ